MNDQNGKNCVVDCRISSTKQQSGGGLEDQERVCASLTNRTGWNVLKVYSKVYSGRAEEREDFNGIERDIKKWQANGTKVDYYVIKSIDRLTRDGAVIYSEMKGRLDRLGVQLVDAYGVIQPDQNTLEHVGFEYKWSKRSPTATAQLAEAQRAKDEVTDILTRTIGAEITLAQDGYSVRSATDGLVNKKVIVGGKNKVIAEADPERAKYFIAMLNLRASGAYSDPEIVEKVNAMGYGSKAKNRWDKGHKNILGRVGGVKLTVKQLQRVIQKTIYAGIKCEKWTRGLPIKAQGFDGIVSIDTFNRANRGKIFIDYKGDADIRILYDDHAEKIIKKRMKNNPRFPYKFIRCPICGKPVTGSVARIHTAKGGFPSYHCSRGHAYFGVNKKTFDGVVEYYVKNLKFEPAYLSGLEATFLNKYREREKEIVNLSAEMGLSVSDLKTQQAAKIEAFVATTNPVIRKTLDEEVTKLDVQIKKAEAERAKIEITESDIKVFIEEAKKVMGQPSEMLLNPTTTGNPRAQQALFGLVFEEIPNYEEIVNGTARLTWIFKLSSEFAGSKRHVGCLTGIGPVSPLPQSGALPLS